MKFNPIKTLTITAAAALLAHPAVNAAENVAESNIAAIYQPTLRTAEAPAAFGGPATEAVSLLDGIVLDWQDPARELDTERSVEPRAVRSDANVALENLRDIYTANSAN